MPGYHLIADWDWEWVADISLGANAIGDTAMTHDEYVTLNALRAARNSAERAYAWARTPEEQTRQWARYDAARAALETFLLQHGNRLPEPRELVIP